MIASQMETHEVHKKQQTETDRPPYASSCRQVCGRSGTMMKNSKAVPNILHSVCW